MAEALGLVATVAQLAGIALKTFQGCKDIYDRIQDTPQGIIQRFNELHDLEAIIVSIRDCPELQTRETAGILERCENTAQKLSQELDSIRFASNDPFGRKTWRSIVGQTKEPEIHGLFEELERIKSSLSLQIQLASLNQHRLMRSDIQNHSSNDSDEDKCLRELFITDPVKDRDDILDAKGNICPGTCEWITSTPEYQSWQRDSPHLLWISAPPGVGKTYMSVYLSKHLESSARYTDAKVLYFFCDNKKDSRNTAVNILRGLLYQLITHQRDLISNLLPQWKIQKSALFQEGSLNILWRLFEDMVERINATNVYCVIDALDECEKSLPSILQKLRGLGERRVSHTKLKLVCLSRRFPECIPQSLYSFTQIKLDTMAAGQSDIQRFISQQAFELTRKKHLGFELQNYIEQQFQQKSQGSFLWVSFMAQDLEKRSVGEIEISLESLPQGLDAVYARLLSQIDPANKAMVFNMLDWIMVAVRPLRVPELCEAINVQPVGRISRERVCMSLIESCGHFLHIARNHEGLPREIRKPWDSDDIDVLPVHTTDSPDYWQLEVTFIHQSAKDYLSTIRSEKHIQIANASVCSQLVRYLSRPGLVHEEAFANAVLANSPLGSYALSAWTHHFKELEDVDSMIKGNEPFFGKRSEIRSNWYPCEKSGPIPLLHMACFLGLPNLVVWCLGRRQIQSRLGFRGHINEVWRYQTPLGFACSFRHEQIARLLLDAGANPAPGDGNMDDSLLYDAIGWFERDTLRMIAATKGGKQWLTLQSRDRGNRLLSRAAQYGNEEAARFLIEDFKWDVNRIGGDPVEIALNHNHLELACTFIAEWHVRTCHWSVLFTVCSLDDDYKFEEILHRLVRAPSFDINAANTRGCNILCSAFGSNVGDSNARVRLLLQNGADATKRNHRGQTPLHCIAGDEAFSSLFRGAEAIESILLHGQTNINATCEKGQTPLHCYISQIASINRTSKVPDGEKLSHIQASLKLLLDLGADPQAKDHRGYTAIYILQSALHYDLQVDTISEEWRQRSFEAGWDEAYFIIQGYKQMVGDFLATMGMYMPAPIASHPAPPVEYAAAYPGYSIPPAGYPVSHVPAAGYPIPPAGSDMRYMSSEGSSSSAIQESASGYGEMDHEAFRRLTTQQVRSEWQRGI